MRRKTGSGNVSGDVEIGEDLYSLEISFSWYYLKATHMDPQESDWSVDEMKITKNGVRVSYDDLSKNIQDRLDVESHIMVSEAEWVEP